MWHILLIIALATIGTPNTEARCMNWCSKNGICTDPGDAGYCICDHGFMGQDCSQKMCPKAFDVFTTDENTPRRTIQLIVGKESGALEGKVELFFNNASILLDANPDNLDSQECTAQVSKLKGVSKASCTNERKGGEILSAYKYTIVFSEWSLIPYENNLFFHDGNPPLDAFMCNVDRVNEFKAVQPYCEVTDVVTDEAAAYLECGNHGDCDHRTGKCDCEHGFHGQACSDTADDKDEAYMKHDGPFFTATVLKAHAIRPLSEEFNFFQVVHSNDKFAATVPVTTVRGDKLLTHAGDAQFGGSLAVELPVTGGEDMAGTVALRLQKQHKLSRNPGGAVMIKSTTSREDDVHVQLEAGAYVTNTETYQEEFISEKVFNISARGDISTTGGIVASRGGFMVEEGGLVTAQSVNIVNSLDVHGSAVVEDSLTIGSGFALTPEGMTIDTNKHTGALLELRSGQEMFNGSLLEINAMAGSNSSVIRTIVDNIATFDVTTAGDLTVATLKMISGGVDVQTGGIQIGAGGLQVHGGLTIHTGSLDIGDATFSAPSIHVHGRDQSSSLLVVEPMNDNFVGTALSVKGRASAVGGYTLLGAEVSGQEVFGVNSDGTVTIDGDMKVHRSVSIGQHTRLNGGLSLAKISVMAGKVIQIPASATFVEVSDDDSNEENVLVLPSRSESSEGQVLIIRNIDASPLQLKEISVKIDFGTTAMFVFDGSEWRDIHALSVQIDKLTGITSLEVLNDIYIGNHTLEAGGVKIINVNRGEVLVGGIGGVLRGRQGLTYRSGVLSTPSIKVGTFESDIDAKSKTISNAVLTKPWIVEGKIEANSVTMTKESGVAFFDQKGHLKGSPFVQLTEDGKLHITDLYEDIHMHEAHITHVGTLSANELALVDKASIRKLFVGRAADAEATMGGVAFTSADGSVDFSDTVFVTDDTLHVKSIGAHAQTGNVDFTGSDIIGANIVGGTANGLKEVSTDALKIGLDATMSDTHKMLFVTRDGQILRDDDSPITAHSVSVETLEVKTSLTVEGGKLTGAILDNVRLAITADANIDKATFIGMDSTGKLVPVPGASYDHSSLQIQNMSVDTLTLNSARIGMLACDEQGRIVASSTVSTEKVSTNTLDVTGKASVASLQVADLVSSILFADASGNVVSARDTSLGSVEADSISTQTITLKGLSAGGVLTADIAGTVTTSSDIEVSKVSTTALDVAGEATIAKLSVSSLSLASVRSGTASPELLAVDETGTITAAGKVSKLSAKAGEFQTISSESVQASSFQLVPEPGRVVLDDSLVSVDKQGRLQAISDVKVSVLSVASQLSVQGILSLGSVTFRDHPSSVLGTSANGDVVTVRGINLAKDGTVELNNVKISALSGDLLLSGHKVVDATLSGSKVKNSEIYIDVEKTSMSGGALVVADKESGLLSGSGAASLTRGGGLKVASIEPISTDAPLTITKATLASATLTDADIHANGIKATTLTLSGVAEFGGDVFADGAISARGSVIGSGPYIDSSDKRFKTNITPIVGALDRVVSLEGVTYDNKCGDFPERKFDTARQIGWIADDMATVLPEVVTEDSEGYKQIAYARVGPVLGQAIKELKQDSDLRFNEIIDKVDDDHDELVSLRKTVNDMQSTINQLANENVRLATLLNDVLKRLGD